MDQKLKLETLAVQAGYTPENGGPRVVPIAQSTTYKYDDAQSVADLFDLKRPGFFYTRLANPTVDCFEKKIAALEGGVAAVATSSGQNANTLAIMLMINQKEWNIVKINEFLIQHDLKPICYAKNLS